MGVFPQSYGVGPRAANDGSGGSVVERLFTSVFAQAFRARVVAGW